MNEFEEFCGFIVGVLLFFGVPLFLIWLLYYFVLGDSALL